MRLNKEQIDYLENRLQKNGITYWDIRIEILDHLASEIETKMAKGESYKSAVENAFFKLKLDGNLEDLNRSRLIRINKIVRRQFFRKIRNTLSSFKNLVIIVVFVSLYFAVYQMFNTKIYIWTSYIILLIPVAIGLVLHIAEYIKKQKSGYLIYNSFYIFFGFLMLNGLLQFFQPEGIFPVATETRNIIWFCVTCVNSIFCYAGISLYLKTKAKISYLEQNWKLL